MSKVSIDLALLFLRIAGAALLMYVHGLPKILNFTHELGVIEDPFRLGAHLTLSLAILAEVLCPVLIILGLFTRLACLPIIVVLLISMLVVHPEWSIAEGQYGWLLLIIFTAVLIAGPGEFSFARKLSRLSPALR